MPKLAPSNPIHVESDAPKPMKTEGSGVPEQVQAEMDMPESTSGLASAKPTFVLEMPTSKPL